MPTKGLTIGGRVSMFDPLLSATHPTGLWKSCPLLEHKFDPSIGFLYDESFANYDATASTGDWTLTQATSGSAAISTTYPGALAIDAGAATSTQGANLQRLKCCFVPATSSANPATTGSIWAEFRVRMTTTVVSELFIGLAASDTTIIAASAVTTNNRIGWSSITDDGVLLFNVDKAGTGTTAAATTISTSAWKRLGFHYDAYADTVQQYIDGVAVGTAIATTYIPKLAVFPSLVCQAAGSGQPVLNVGGFRIFQLR